MTILVAHNHYRNPGGEDQVFYDEARLLELRGQRVVRYEDTNHRLNGVGPIGLLAGAIWNGDSHRRIRRLVREHGAELVHFHNTFPLLSPSCYHAAKEEGAVVVQTLHNYRLLCPNANLFRNGAPCEKCLGRAVAWPGVMHGCYRDSRPATAAVAAMLSVHRALGTWQNAVDIYIALSEFARSKFLAAGFPADRVVVKPGFIHPDPGAGSGGGGYALFAGRLSPEKGLETLIEAWRRLGSPFPLKIAGDGPLGGWLGAEIRPLAGIEWLGHVSRQDVLGLMKEARFLVFPSRCYEGSGSPVSVMEAFAAGCPVIAGDAGSLKDLVDDGRSGLRFRPGDADDLAAKVEWAFSRPWELHRMRQQARAEFEAKYTAERNYPLLMEIYARARAAAG